MYRSFLLGISLSALAVLAGCSSRSPSDLQTDSITITNITPTAGSDLVPGSAVTVTAAVSYASGSARTGTIRLVIEDQNNNSLTATQKTVSVNKGQGAVNLVDQFTLPATGVTAVQVFVSLTPGSASTTNIVAGTTYPVG
jgi:hypothetical protein